VAEEASPTNTCQHRASRGLENIRTRTARLITILIIGAFVRARSWTMLLQAHIWMTSVYNSHISLLKSEARHYEDYLSLHKSMRDSMRNCDIF